MPIGAVSNLWNPEPTPDDRHDSCTGACQPAALPFASQYQRHMAPQGTSTAAGCTSPLDSAKAMRCSSQLRQRAVWLVEQ